MSLKEVCFAALLYSSMVYGLWRTKNDIKHASQPNTKEQILKGIFGEVQTRIVRKEKFSKTRESITLCSLWNFPTDLLV
jgi:hypothetical protein